MSERDVWKGQIGQRVWHGHEGWELVEYDSEYQPSVELLVYERGRERAVVLRGTRTGRRIVADRGLAR